MPPVSKFEGEQRRLRWSSYLRQYLGDGKITPTALNARLGGAHAVSRVTAWLRGTRGLEEDTAWEVGRALRELGAESNEIEALWAGGFFGAVIRLLQFIAADSDDGTRRAVELYALLPARMLEFEMKLCADIDEGNVEHGLTDLGVYYALFLAKTERYTEVGKSSAALVKKMAEAAYALEPFATYQRAWENASRGGNPVVPASRRGWFRGDDDLVEVMVDAVARMKERWIPSLLVLRLWRIGADWASEITPSDEAAFSAIPDLFLPAATRRARAAEVDAYYEDLAAMAAADQWRGK